MRIRLPGPRCGGVLLDIRPTGDGQWMPNGDGIQLAARVTAVVTQADREPAVDYCGTKADERSLAGRSAGRQMLRGWSGQYCANIGPPPA